MQSLSLPVYHLYTGEPPESQWIVENLGCQSQDVKGKPDRSEERGQAWQESSQNALHTRLSVREAIQSEIGFLEVEAVSLGPGQFLTVLKWP